ncbi:MAG: hypothetical protein A2Y15_05530 [Clostridiales bacterium GWF2_36_10]|nr:MAG: hypothetical protein A2Y15_05530 [Clostridiales bacterium GWF2_36_10]HAN21996.1 hypothetical protein [Clostridiales bacterium]
MTGLEKLVKHIEDEAQAAADIVISEAKKKADELLEKAKAEGELKSAEILQRSQLDVQAALNRSDSTALLQEKKLLLKAKQQMIDKILSDAKEKLFNLPDSEYFDVILKMIKKYALKQTGKIAFSIKDKARMPVDFEERVKKELSSILFIANETRNIDGGFILIYGDVEENCSFDALFFAAKETLQDKVSSILFG